MQPLYDDPKLAAAYARVTRENCCNAAYERPALRTVIGDVDGLRLLDAGCAAGEHAAWFAARGARVTALDASPAMVELARERLPPDVRVLQHDLNAVFPFGDGSFDLVVSSLTMHYLPDWAGPLREIHRVLRPGGRFVLSTHHPFITIAPQEPYRDVRVVQELWASFSQEPVPVAFYHRPLERIFNDIVGAGFVVPGLYEPGSDQNIASLDPALAERLKREPLFLILDAVRRE